jgi:copper chaperone CopZ
VSREEGKMDNAEVFAYGNGGHIWMPPGAVIPGPPGTMWQLVPVVGTPKSKEKSEKDKQDGGTEKKQTPAKQDKQEKQQPKFELKVNMCCAKCAEKVKEEIFEVYGVVDVQTDIGVSKVTVFGKPDPLRVLKKARKVHKKAEFIGDPLAEQKKTEVKSEKKPVEQSSEESPLLTTTYRNSYVAKPSIAPYYGITYYAAPDCSSTYRPSQCYPPNHYPQYLETDYSSYVTNSNYLTPIKTIY